MLCTIYPVVHNIALHRLGGAQDDFACTLSNFFDGVQCSVVSLGVWVCACGDKNTMTHGIQSKISLRLLVLRGHLWSTSRRGRSAFNTT